MKVNGREVDDSILYSVESRIDDGTPFRLADLRGIAMAGGLSWGDADRLGDRVLNRRKRKGQIKANGNTRNGVIWVKHHG